MMAKQAVAVIRQNIIIALFKVITLVTNTHASEAKSSAEPENIANKKIFPLIVAR